MRRWHPNGMRVLEILRPLCRADFMLDYSLFCLVGSTRQATFQGWWFQGTTPTTCAAPLACLLGHGKARARLDQIAGVLVFDDNAAFRRVTAAPAAVDQETRPATHVIARVGIQLVAVGHAFEGHHVAQSVLALRQGADHHLALAAGVVSARARGAAAAACRVDLRPVESHAGKTMSALAIGVWATGLEIVARYLELVAVLRGVQTRGAGGRTQERTPCNK